MLDLLAEQRSRTCCKARRIKPESHIHAIGPILPTFFSLPDLAHCIVFSWKIDYSFFRWELEIELFAILYPHYHFNIFFSLNDEIELDCTVYLV